MLDAGDDIYFRRDREDDGIDACAAQGVGISEHPATGELPAEVSECQSVGPEEILEQETPRKQRDHRPRCHEPWPPDTPANSHEARMYLTATIVSAMRGK